MLSPKPCDFKSAKVFPNFSKTMHNQTNTENGIIHFIYCLQIGMQHFFANFVHYTGLPKKDDNWKTIFICHVFKCKVIYVTLQSICRTWQSIYKTLLAYTVYIVQYIARLKLYIDCQALYIDCEVTYITFHCVTSV